MIEKEDLKDLYIQIPNDYFNDSNISNEELVIYSLLRRHYIQAKEISVISINWLMNVLKIDTKNTRSRNKIIKSIESLNKKDIINLYDSEYNSMNSMKDVKKTELFYISVELLETDYFQVNDIELNKIFKYCKDRKLDIFALTRYYIAICRVCNSGQNLGYLTQNSIGICGSNKTLTDYNGVLADIGVIYYNNNYVTPRRLNAATYFSTRTSITEEEFNKLVSNEADSRGYILGNKDKANKMRSKSKTKINKNKNKTT